MSRIIKVLDRPIKITVCADGFVSIMSVPKHRRLGAGLPVHSSDSLEQALMLVSRVCSLKPCLHKGKLGMTLEPHAPWWPESGDAHISDIDVLAGTFQVAENELIEEANKTTV